MPETPKPRYSDFSRFDSMTNGELEEILRLDAQNIEGEESDTEMLLYVMEVLAERRRKSENHGKSAKEAFKTFQEYYLPESDSENLTVHTSEPVEKKTAIVKMPAWLHRATAAAAIVVLVVLGATTVSAFGYDLWDIVVQWTQETFHLGSANSTEAMDLSTSDGREFASLQEALDQEEISTPLVPTWVPDGYDFVSVQIEESPVQKKYLAIYACDDGVLMIQIKRHLNDDPQQIEQSEDLIEIYESSGISYYIFDNYDQLSAAWINNSFECYISGQLSIAEMKDIIDSITKE